MTRNESKRPIAGAAQLCGGLDRFGHELGCCCGERDGARCGGNRLGGGPCRVCARNSGEEFARFVAAALLDVLGLLPFATHLPALLENRAVAELYVPTVLVFCEQVPELGVLRRLRHVEHDLCLSCGDESSSQVVV